MCLKIYGSPKCFISRCWHGKCADTFVIPFHSYAYLILEFSTFFLFIPGLIWSEIKQLWDVGLREYVNDMWNVIDFVTNSLYVATIALRLVAYYKVSFIS